ncbi:MAG: hypothetical protein IKT28_05535 [Rikenellaceae bacterium]|nr:hypothetical protein [Rikenellaceae bacterium]
MEFGSHFHSIEQWRAQQSDSLPSRYLLTVGGRQSLGLLLKHNGWSRLWLPAYFCGDVAAYLSKCGVELMTYEDSPTADDERVISRLNLREGDALLRVNYFGLRGVRSNAHLPVPVIEDHSHDLTGEWAVASDADWCIASLRKSLPVAEGGIIWSPRNLPLPEVELASESCVGELWWRAMDLKRDYLSGAVPSKEEYLAQFRVCEDAMAEMAICAPDVRSREVIEYFDVRGWNAAKCENWNRLTELLGAEVRCLKPENNRCNPFSAVLLFESRQQRDAVRNSLISEQIYPAILWAVESGSAEAVDFSSRMLSIHCDGRYTRSDMEQLAEKIKHILR